MVGHDVALQAAAEGNFEAQGGQPNAEKAERPERESRR